MLPTLQKKYLPSAFYIFFLLNLTLNQNAFSATWKNISKNESGEYSFDQESIIGSVNNKEISIKVNILKDPKEGDKSRLLRYLINCSTSTLLLNEVKRYSEFELNGVETVFKVNATETVPKPNTLGQRYIDIACGTSSNNSLNVSKANTPPSQINFNFVSKFDSNDIKYKLLDKTFNKESIEGFQFNYSFIHSLLWQLNNASNSNSPYDIAARKAFMPQFNSIEKNVRGMNNFIENIARSINVQPKLVYEAFGIEFQNNGTLNENKIQKIANGRLTSNDYWFRYGGTGRSVNEWYDTKDPKFLFESFYPQYISEYNADIPKLLTTAKIYEETQVKSAQQRDDRQKWLQTVEGKKYLADEEAKRKKAEDDRLKALALEEAKIVKEFPFVARFTCTTNGYPVNFISCLYGSNSVNTEIEIKNGQEYKLYQGSEFANNFPDDKGAKVVNLRSNYSIVAQNASSNLILGLKIIDRKTGATVFEKQVSQFGAIKVRN
jgi:hypothetical protein